MKSRTVAIIQARVGSTRFPGKMTALLGTHTLLEWVALRVRRTKRCEAVILATSDLSRDDALVEIAERCGVEVFRGSETDVLERFLGAARGARAGNVVRVCADNPFISPEEIDRLVEFYCEHPCDYAFNHQARLGGKYADGFGAEILSVPLLEEIARKTADSRHREHVTLYLWDHAHDYSIRAVPTPSALAYPELVFDVDEQEDLQKLQQLVRRDGISLASPATEIISNALSGEMQDYLERLFPLCRSITGEPNRATLKTLQEIAPIEMREIPSGTKVYDWVVPDEWAAHDAWIACADGRRVVDFGKNNLHLMSYSEPVQRRIGWPELKAHLHKHPRLPDAVPYRTSYYQRNWGFCVTHAQYDELEKSGGELEVFVDSTLRPGSLTYGEILIPGRSRREVLISCYICHPSMANDSLSGVVLTAFLARHIAGLQNRHWSYRIVFVPETIGAVAYCACNERAIRDIDMGLVITTVGGPGRFGYKKSWQGDHPINRLIEDVLKETGEDFAAYPFDIHGSDERQYSAQGFRVNVATISKDRYYEYPEYHSSLDNLSFVTGRNIRRSFALYCRLIEKLESRRVYRNTVAGCEVMLSRHGLYPADGGAQRPSLGGRSELDLLLWLLFLSDGHLSLEDIAVKLGVDTSALEPLAETLLEKGIFVDV